MLELDGIVGLALLGLWIYCLIDVISTPEGSARNLPKMVWLLIVILLASIGSVLWLLAGRPRTERAAPNARAGSSGFYAGAQPGGYPEYERLGRSTAEDSAADAEFLRQCRARAEEQRVRYLKSKRDDQT